MSNTPTVKISERSVKAVRSNRPQDLSILDRLTCITLEVLTYGQQSYCQNFRKIGKGCQNLSSPSIFLWATLMHQRIKKDKKESRNERLAVLPTDLQINRGIHLWPTNLLSKFRNDRSGRSEVIVRKLCGGKKMEKKWQTHKVSSWKGHLISSVQVAMVCFALHNLHLTLWTLDDCSFFMLSPLKMPIAFEEV